MVSLPARPASARLVYRDGKTLMDCSINGSIIAISYEARAKGVTRFFKGKEAIAACPEIVIVQVVRPDPPMPSLPSVLQVPTNHGKSDMGIYRSLGAQTLKLVHEVCGAGTATEKVPLTVPHFSPQELVRDRPEMGGFCG